MALSQYYAIVDTKTRANFINQFESNGSGKGPNSLKFALQFTKTLSAMDTTECSSVDNFITRAKVLELCGMRISDFDSKEEAFAVLARLEPKRTPAPQCILTCICLPLHAHAYVLLGVHDVFVLESV